MPSRPLAQSPPRPLDLTHASGSVSSDAGVSGRPRHLVRLEGARRRVRVEPVPRARANVGRRQTLLDARAAAHAQTALGRLARRRLLRAARRRQRKNLPRTREKCVKKARSESVGEERRDVSSASQGKPPTGQASCGRRTPRHVPERTKERGRWRACEWRIVGLATPGSRAMTGSFVETAAAGAAGSAALESIDEACVQASRADTKCKWLGEGEGDGEGKQTTGWR
eukprot:3167290-Pleurochrysis_carterae.AAC.4